MANTYRILGLMSGSSLDGLDIAVCNFTLDKTNPSKPVTAWNMEIATTIPYSEMWQARLAHLPHQSALVFAKTNTYFGYYMGELVHAFLNQHNINVDAIASHGHTVFHAPDKRFTSQIGDGAALAMTTGLPVCCDFRTTDIAIGGEGTPLAPLADAYLFGGYDFYLNLGGIANISASTPQGYVAFDIGGCNQILNTLAQLEGLAYDNNGALAAQGVLVTGLMYTINQLPYFTQDYPKSLDNQWVQQELVKRYLEADGNTMDKLRTACEQLAFQTQQAIRQITKTEKLRKERYTLFLSGGGAFNGFLLTCLRDYCPQIDFIVPSPEIIAFKEAILMALMGSLRLEGIPNCFASVTGATYNTIGGALYQPFS